MNDANKDIRSCGAYLLAAGKGSRAGGPKAWLPYAGSTLLATQLDFALQHLQPAAIAVSIQANWRDRCDALQRDVRWVAVEPDAPPLAALQALLQQQPLSRWSFLWHVDMPVWEADVFAQIARAQQADVLAVVPTWNGRGGHPVLLAPECQTPLLALDPQSDRLDHWLRSVPVKRVDVPFACIHQNWNAGPPDE